MTKTKQLWRRVGSHFVVEIKVGRVWVGASTERYDTHAKAAQAALKVLGDPGVLGARVVEIATTQTAALVWEEQSGPELKVPRAMRATGKKVICPLCKRSVAAMTDGVTQWAFCQSCSRANPVAEA
jgi:hypothetical protein